MKDDPRALWPVRAHALKNYGKDGWDILVECWTDDDILKAMDKAVTLREAIKNIGEILAVADSRRKDVESEIW
jgi:hypothetical protein